MADWMTTVFRVALSPMAPKEVMLNCGSFRVGSTAAVSLNQGAISVPSGQRAVIGVFWPLLVSREPDWQDKKHPASTIIAKRKNRFAMIQNFYDSFGGPQSKL